MRANLHELGRRLPDHQHNVYDWQFDHDYLAGATSGSEVHRHAKRRNSLARDRARECNNDGPGNHELEFRSRIDGRR